MLVAPCDLDDMEFSKALTVVDLFSGCGGTSAGFARRGGFRLAAAVDKEVGKPSGAASDCNRTYQANLDLVPLARDLATFGPEELAAQAGLHSSHLDVLVGSPPCTDFSRAVPSNHARDGERNDLVGRVALFAEELKPSLVLIENAPEMIRGTQHHHHRRLVARLKAAGYQVRSEVQLLTRAGLPQARQRAFVVASRVGRPLTLRDLWRGWTVRREAVTVRTALARLSNWQLRHPDDQDGDVWPSMGTAVSARIKATPINGGGWADLAASTLTAPLLTRDCQARWQRGATGSHPDIYGRMSLDRPAPTIKRECSHVGNGRYAHPTADRLLTVREMATLQGFPFDFRFPTRSVTARYAHIGDAVPPLISFQLATIATWMLGGSRPDPSSWIMPNTTLQIGDLVRVH